jgi:protein TonB
MNGPVSAAPGRIGSPKGSQQEIPIERAIPRYDVNPKPTYPGVARRRGYQGRVLLAVRVLPDGTVGGVKVARSSGYKVLDEAALRAVRKWRFVPGRRGDQPIEMAVQVPLTFRLR